MIEDNKVKDFLTTHHVKVASESGDELLCHCPLHQPDKNPSFSINMKTGLWICYSENRGGNFPQLFAELEGCSLEQAYTKLKGHENLLTQVQARIKYKLSKKQEQKTHKLSFVTMPHGFASYRTSQECPEYLLKRLSWSTIETFKLGECTHNYYKNRVIIPISDRYQYVGYLARDYTEKAEKPYLVPKDFDVKRYLFNMDEALQSKRFKNFKELIVVEGVFDAMSIYEKRFRNVVASFGADLTDLQIHRLAESGVSSVVMCYDNDTKKKRNTGQENMLELAKTMQFFFQHIYIMKLPPGSDPNEITREQFIESYLARKKYSQKRHSR